MRENRKVSLKKEQVEVKVRFIGGELNKSSLRGASELDRTGEVNEM